MTSSPGDIEAPHVKASDTPKRRSIRVLGWLVAAVIAAQLLNLWLQQGRPPEPPRILSDASMLADPRAPTLGSANGDVTIYLFSDYACPSCRAMYPDLIRLFAADKGVRLVYRDWPVLTPNSIHAAKLVIASDAQGRHAAFDRAVMRYGGSLDDAALKAAAGRAGVDWTRLLADYAAHRSDVDDLIARSSSYARALGFVGTPTMVVGPYLVTGRQSAERLQELVAQARGKAPA